ncbi:complex I NDUFA9 subunit family protein [Rhodanobacter caeni]|uniref:Complex I NDUFA9 subunit family protein n=1 Tax=Rhodanobacter caeni TaxID=657654 RepID=A0ABN0UG57_9GAMM
MPAQRLVVLGGTGFVGRHLVPRLAADGHTIVLLSRNRARHRELGVLPGVQVRSADVHDPATLQRELAGFDAVINLVGILNPRGVHSFEHVHVALVEKLIEACRINGVTRLHQMSALKAGQGLSLYLKSRGQMEARVRQSGLDWTLYQPSVMFGDGDGLVTRFARLLRRLPVLPLARARARLAPTWVGDVATAIARCVYTPALGRERCFELYGPDVLSLGEIVRQIRAAGGYRTPILELPDGLGRLQAQVAELLPGKPFSLDNFRSLRTDSVGRHDGYAMLGITPQAFAAWAPRLLETPARERRLSAARSLRR